MEIERHVQASGRCVVALLVAAALAGCGHEVLSPEPGVSGTLIFQMDRAPAFLAAATITVTGPGISPAIVATAHIATGGATDTLTVLAGSNRNILVSAFDSGGALAYRGDTIINVIPGPNPTLSMVLQPLSGGVGIVITFNPGTVSWTQLVQGSESSCGLTTTGATYCWGKDSLGVLGDGGGPIRTAPVLVQGGVAFTSLALGYFHTCGLTGAGLAYCWGMNDDGRLGDGTTTARGTPVPVAGGLTFTSLVAGGVSTCGLTAGGAAYCWGRNDQGQIGDGSYTNRSVPVPVGGGITFASLTMNYLHACGLTGAGAAYCWGYNVYGGLGDGSTTNRTTPVAVSGGLTFASLVAGGYTTCGITAGGAAYCWGENNLGELGTSVSLPGCFDGYATWPCSTHPIPVDGGLTFASLAASNGTNCGLTSAGTAYCWGLNQWGQVGDGSNTNRYAPTPVAGGHTFAKLGVAGGSHECAVANSGAAYCWGWNAWGELGDSTTTNRNTPVAVVNP